MKIGFIRVLAAWVVLSGSASAANNWVLYDDFSSESIDDQKWAMVVENSSADPRIESDRVNCSATLDEGVCKIDLRDLLDSTVYGVKADLTLSSAVNDSGNEIEIGLSNGGEGYLDIGMYNSNLYINAYFEDASEDMIMNQGWGGVPDYGQAYTLAVVIEGGVIKCFVDNVLLCESDPIAGLTGTNTSYAIGSWSDVDDAEVGGYIDNVYVLRSENNVDLSNHVEWIEIAAGYALEEGQYVVEFELEAMDWHSIESVSVVAPFDTFVCEQDWSYWEYEHAVSDTSPLPVDGDWIVMVAFTNGSVGTTTIPFALADGTPIPNVTNCPALISPVLPAPGGWMFATNGIMLEWNAAFDAQANAAGVDWENSADDYDFCEFSGPLSSYRTYDPVDVEAGTENIGIYNAHEFSGENADGIEFEVDKFAYHGYDVNVVDREWDADQDHISNEWEFKYFGSLTACDPDGDADLDGISNAAEFQAGTNPTNAASRFVVSAGANTSGSGFQVDWAPVANREYAVYWSTNLTAGFERIVSKLTAPQSSYVDSEHAGQQGYYYVGVDRVNTNANAVQSLEIQVDGNAADWNGLQPQFIDPVEPDIDPAVDITGITLAKGVSNLFVKVDREGPDTTGEPSNIWIYLEAPDAAVNYAIELFYNGSDYYPHLYSANDEFDYDEHILIPSNLSFADDDCIEVAIPLSQLTLVDHYTLSCYTQTQFFEDGEWNNEDGEDWRNPRTTVVMPY